MFAPPLPPPPMVLVSIKDFAIGSATAAFGGSGVGAFISALTSGALAGGVGVAAAGFCATTGSAGFEAAGAGVGAGVGAIGVMGLTSEGFTAAFTSCLGGTTAEGGAGVVTGAEAGFEGAAVLIGSASFTGAAGDGSFSAGFGCSACLACKGFTGSDAFGAEAGAAAGLLSLVSC